MTSPSLASRLLAPFVATVAGVVVAATMSAGPAHATATEGSIRPAGTATAVPGSYIIVLKDTAGVAGSARALTTRYGGTVGRTFTSALHGFEIEVSEAAAKAIAGDPSVAYVQQNGIYQASITQNNPPSWGLDRIDRNFRSLNRSYDYPTAAAGVHAYIIDTGIRFSHVDFGGRAVSGRDTMDNDNDAADCNGHGTHVAGITGGASFGVAKGVTLVGVRVLDCDGGGTSATVIAGVDWVTANAIRPAVANMSLGGGGDNAIDTAVANSIASGITYSIAAGNGTNNDLKPIDACNVSPARVPAAITVASTNSSDARSFYSNYGTCVDIFAPGEDIPSAWNTSDTATAILRGTSMSAPHVAGAAAIVLAQHPGFTPQQVRDQLVNLDPTVGVVSNPGTGSPNKLLFIRFGPMRTLLTCSTSAGRYVCDAEPIGGVGPFTYQWPGFTSSSSRLYGNCPTSRWVTVTVTVTDSLAATASATSPSFYCREICGIRTAAGLFCAPEPLLAESEDHSGDRGALDLRRI